MSAELDSARARIRSRVVIKDEAPHCWEWQGRIDKHGYGRIGRCTLAHRAAYAAFRGAVPDGASVCHSCDNPRCCNPDHLWVGSPKDNMQDARAKRRLSGMSLTHCKHGHPFDAANTHPRANGGRQCRACANAAAARHRAKATGRALPELRP